MCKKRKEHIQNGEFFLHIIYTAIGNTWTFCTSECNVRQSNLKETKTIMNPSDQMGWRRPGPGAHCVAAAAAVGAVAGDMAEVVPVRVHVQEALHGMSVHTGAVAGVGVVDVAGGAERSVGQAGTGFQQDTPAQVGVRDRGPPGADDGPDVRTERRAAEYAHASAKSRSAGRMLGESCAHFLQYRIIACIINKEAHNVVQCNATELNIGRQNITTTTRELSQLMSHHEHEQVPEVRVPQIAHPMLPR